MSSIDTSTLDRLIETFKQLPNEEKLISLALIFRDIDNTLPALASPSPSDEVLAVVKQVTDTPESEQLSFLQAVLSGTDNTSSTVMSDYRALNDPDRITLWYQLAGEMGKRFVATPENYYLSAEAEELVRSIDSYDANEKIRFMSQIV